jgi:DNA-directed RNA polymerase specialized sigma24 family protein
MESPEPSQNIDGVLLSLLQTNELELPGVLDQILSLHAEPVISRIIRYRLPTAVNPNDRKDLEDVHGDIVLRLLTRLHDFRSNPDTAAIHDFGKYVAVVAHNACNEYFREKYPERSRLKNRLRYLLGHQPAFAIWKGSDQDWLCGLKEWRERNSPAHTDKFHQLRNHPASWERSGQYNEDLLDLVNQLFHYLENPLLLDDLVSIVAALLGIKEKLIHDDGTLLERLPGPVNEKEPGTDPKRYMVHLWTEIGELPSRQRKALLLNLRDAEGGNLLSLFSHAGVAGIRHIAETLEMAATDFANLWLELPISDTKIADLLNATRQQVINLRKSARQRLARRMKEFEETEGSIAKTKW